MNDDLDRARTEAPKRKCASINSRPLFMSVAESMVIFGPMLQVGCASASAGVTAASSSRVRPRNGPPDAVRTSECDGLRRPPFEALEERRVLAVDGQDPPATSLLRRERELARGDEALLVREREVDRRLERRERRGQTREADHGVEDDVRLGTPTRSSSGGSPPSETWRTPRSPRSP